MWSLGFRILGLGVFLSCFTPRGDMVMSLYADFALYDIAFLRPGFLLHYTALYVRSSGLVVQENGSSTECFSVLGLVLVIARTEAKTAVSSNGASGLYGQFLLDYNRAKAVTTQDCDPYRVQLQVFRTNPNPKAFALAAHPGFLQSLTGHTFSSDASKSCLGLEFTRLGLYLNPKPYTLNPKP